MKNFKQTYSRTLSLALFFVLCAGAFGHGAETQAKYVFFFIGDGMANVQRHAAQIYKNVVIDGGSSTSASIESKLLMNTFPAQGMAMTYSADSYITDSAAAGTALATGNKTNSGVISMDPSGETSYKSIAYYAKDAGMKVGIVTSVSIDHATPAVFYANHANRRNYYEIGQQMATSGFDFFGGGSPRWSKNPDGTEGSTTNPKVSALMESAGYSYASTKAELEALSSADLPIFSHNPIVDSSSAMPFELDRDPDAEWSLAQFTEKAIEVLDNDDGFFLMVEGGKIDWACHANDAKSAILDTLAFDDAIAKAYAFYQLHPEETLIVVTGDHETGGMTIGFAGTKYATYFTALEKQSKSYVAHGAVAENFRNGVATLDIVEVVSDIQTTFGLLFVTDEEKAQLEAAATNGDVEAERKLERAMSQNEIEQIVDGFVMTLTDEDTRPEETIDYWLKFGSYEPFTTVMTHVLNQKAGIGWTSYSHTGVPVMTSAIGASSSTFNGYYENTAIFDKLKAAMGL